MLRIFSAIIGIGVFCCAAVLAGSISGKLADPLGNAIPGGRLSLLHEGNIVATRITDQSGAYSFHDLAAGDYILSVVKLGFRHEQIELRLEPGESLRREIELDLETLAERVVVTATRTETPASLLGASISVITAAEIEARNETRVADVLRSTPAVSIVQVGGPGSLTSIFLRGGNSNYTKIFLDGIPLNQPGGAVDLSSLSTTNVERIEVVRGPQSALYGSDAISGVIQIFTKKEVAARTTPRLGFFLEGGSYRTGRGGGAVAGQLGRVSYNTEFQHLSTDNRVPNDFFRNNSFSANLGILLSSNSSLAVTGRTERARQGAPGQTALGPPDLEEYSRTRNFAFRAAWDHRVSDAWQQKLAYAESYANLLSEDPVDSGCHVPEFKGRRAAFSACDFVFSSLNASRRRVTHYQSDLSVGAHLASLGFEWEEERGAVSTARARRNNFGYYFQDQLFVSQRLAVTAGLRLEDNDSFGFAAVPKASLAWQLTSGRSSASWGPTRARFNFGQGIKEPTFLESFSPNPFFRGNPDLRPEKATSFEIGLEQDLAGHRLQVEVNSFYNRFKDQIALRTTDPATFAASFVNVAQSHSWGVEQVVRASLAGPLHLTGGYTYLRTKLLRSASASTPLGTPLLRRPTHSGFVGIIWSSRQWTLSSNATLTGKRADSDFQGLGLTSADGYARWDLSASYRVTPRLEFYTRLENILNQDYFESPGFQSLKLNFRSGFRIHSPE
ncbi:MAG: TonB-dependent receptor [Acidobacteria bacterium]|nr:TonB-dependent receptor [Acidobacteriota bacterium]